MFALTEDNLFTFSCQPWEYIKPIILNEHRTRLTDYRNSCKRNIMYKSDIFKVKKPPISGPPMITLHYYSPKAYEYIRSIVPLPNKSLIRKSSSKCACEPGFTKEAFASLSTANDKDYCLIIDAMAIRKQTIWNSEKDQYSGFVDLGGVIPNTKPDTLASIRYFLINKITAENQAALVLKSLGKAAKAGLKVWSVTAGPEHL